MASEEQQRWSLDPNSRRLAEQVGQHLARYLDGAIQGTPLQGKLGFAVLLFTFETGFLTHISNADRESLAKALRETADVLDANLDEPPISSGRADG